MKYVPADLSILKVLFTALNVLHPEFTVGSSPFDTWYPKIPIFPYGTPVTVIVPLPFDFIDPADAFIPGLFI